VKVKEIEPKLQELEREWQEKRVQEQEEQNIKAREVTLQEKKAQQESIKKKIDFLGSHSQYRYYKLLRDLDYGRAGCVAIDNKI
jgi:predicted Holliday junction resolvase-like endonuclease